MADIFDLFRQIETKKTTVQPISAIIVGLGNPGKQYENTRHNLGFMAMNTLAESCGVKCDRLRFHALCGEATIGNSRVLLMEPQTYMNNSGEAVGEAASFYKIPPEKVIVLFDDMTLEPGNMRIRTKGSAGGHNGIKSIIAHLNSDAFPRIKFGAGIPPQGADIVNWVLGGVGATEKEKINECFKRAIPALELILAGDTEGAMCRYNGKGKAE